MKKLSVRGRNTYVCTYKDIRFIHKVSDVNNLTYSCVAYAHINRLCEYKLEICRIVAFILVYIYMYY